MRTLNIGINSQEVPENILLLRLSYLDNQTPSQPLIWSFCIKIGLSNPPATMETKKNPQQIVENCRLSFIYFVQLIQISVILRGKII
jgi:hypothetical protein